MRYFKYSTLIGEGPLLDASRSYPILHEGSVQGFIGSGKNSEWEAIIPVNTPLGLYLGPDQSKVFLTRNNDSFKLTTELDENERNESVRAYYVGSYSF